LDDSGVSGNITGTGGRNNAEIHPSQNITVSAAATPTVVALFGARIASQRDEKLGPFCSGVISSGHRAG
jgi:hypothetical protein